MKRPPIDPELLRDRLAAAQGKSYWRGLEEIADEPAVRAMIQREFPDGASEWHDPISRRRFLTLMGASLALAGLSGCMRPPTGTIRPFVRQPETMVPGKPLFYATSMSLSGYATGLLVESHEGRPTKIEGNPLHPASLGATSAMQQAAVLGLYDPDRAKTVTYRGQPRVWNDLVEELRSRSRLRSQPKGKGVALLTEAVGSPTLAWQLGLFLKDYPEAKWFTYEPVNRDNVLAGSRLAFDGTIHHCFHKLDKADVVVSIDADLFGRGPSHLADVRAFMARRRGSAEKGDMNRLYALETEVTITGAKADNRLALKPSEIEVFTRHLARKLGVPGVPPVAHSEVIEAWAAAIADDLNQHVGRSLIVAGDGQPATVHALVHAINHRQKNVGQTVFYTAPVLPPQGASANDLAELTKLIENDSISTLLILGGNPAYTAPADIAFSLRLARALEHRPKADWLAVHCSPYFDETARLCHWHVPQSHFLEAWSDAVAFDGTASLVQPLIAPLYASKSFHEIVASLSKRKEEKSEDLDRSGLELVQAYWEKNQPESTKKDDFDTFWQKSLHDGVLSGTAPKATTPALDVGLARHLRDLPTSKGVEISFAPDTGVYDGRFGNLGWMQEWPRPITRLTWDNAALMSVRTAEQYKVSNAVGNGKGGEHGDMHADRIDITVAGKTLRRVPVLIVPGHADDAITLHLGYGRTYGGKLATGVGKNANEIRTAAGAWSASVAKIDPAKGQHTLAVVQGHHSMEGRDIVRSATLGEFRGEPKLFQKHDTRDGKLDRDATGRVELPTLVTPREYPGYMWGMAVDLTSCTGCGACVTACQSENNTPVVGKEQVTRGREMHWIRIDRYIEMPAKAIEEAPRSWHFQPVMCQHCENAPCEMVCPVEATLHGDEGTNDMVYNRCVGTRYCSHNCPYKVRRFNFLELTDYKTPSLKLLYNPDVTVRTRGVMEKCSFCIQRISHARIDASKEQLDKLPRRDDPNGRMVQGTKLAYIDTTEKNPELLTACQAACPAEAIVFGDLGDKHSRVFALHNSSRRYDLLGEHGVRPRVAYLGELRNPNPKLAPKKDEEK